MNRIDDANSGYIYSLYVRVLSYGERLRPAVSIRSAAMRLLSLRGVAMRLLGRQPLLLTSEPPEAASSQKQADVAPEPPVLPETPRVLQEAAEASRPAMSKVFWCCTPGLEGAVFSLFALDLKPMSSFIESAMVSSTKDISYFVTDTAAYIVSKMWDDLLAGVLFRMNTIFLCSPEHHRPCNRPADAGVQLKYCVVVVVVCAFIKTHVERHYAKQNRGTLVIPGMLGMLVGWTFGRAFQQLRQGLEAHVLGCAQWGRPQHVHGSDFNFMYILTGVAPETEAAPTPDDMECEMLAASGHTTLFRMLFAFLITLLSSLLILLLEPAAALETFGSSAMRRRVGVRIKSVVQLFCKAAATTSMILCDAAAPLSLPPALPQPLPSPRHGGGVMDSMGGGYTWAGATDGRGMSMGREHGRGPQRLMRRMAPSIGHSQSSCPRLAVEQPTRSSAVHGLSSSSLKGVPLVVVALVTSTGSPGAALPPDAPALWPRQVERRADGRRHQGHPERAVVGPHPHAALLLDGDDLRRFGRLAPLPELVQAPDRPGRGCGAGGGGGG
jgi:hypothetical protein